MGSKAKAPTPPDPTTVSNAQSAANLASAQAQQKLNLINTSGPDGAVNYVADPNSPGGYTQQTTLSPGQQALYDQGNVLQQGALGTANKALGAADSALGQKLDPLAFDQAGADAVYKQGASRLDPQFQQQDSAMRARLAAQGLVPGTQAYDRAYGNFSRDKNDAYSSLENQSVLTGKQFGQQDFTNSVTAQNQPINQLSALLGLGQVATPQGINYSPTGVGQTDVTGAYALNQQGQQAAYQAKMQNQQATLGGLFNLGAAALAIPTGGASLAAKAAASAAHPSTNSAPRF